MFVLGLYAKWSLTASLLIHLEPRIVPGGGKMEAPMKIGEDYIGNSVVFACHDGEGNFLFSKRSLECRDEQETWDIGGGRIEFRHRIIDTLKKEIAEEYCTDVLDSEFLGYRDVHRENNGVPTHWIALDFLVHVDRSKVANGEPHKADDMQWFTLDTLPAPMHSQLPHFFSLYKEKLLAASPT